MNTRRLFWTFLVFSTFAIASPARATLLSGTIAGSVTSAGGSVPGVMTGSLVSGSYTYDDAVAVNGFVATTNPFTTFALAIGNNTHIFTLADLQNSGGLTPGVIPSLSTPAANSLFFFFTSSALTSYLGSTGNTSQAITFSNPERFDVTDITANSFTFLFTASRGVAVNAVPEPATIALFGLGCVAALGLRRRKAHDASRREQ